jgi:hypothetical protein
MAAASPHATSLSSTSRHRTAPGAAAGDPPPTLADRQRAIMESYAALVRPVDWTRDMRHHGTSRHLSRVFPGGEARDRRREPFADPILGRIVPQSKLTDRPRSAGGGNDDQIRIETSTPCGRRFGTRRSNRGANELRAQSPTGPRRMDAPLRRGIPAGARLSAAGSGPSLRQSSGELPIWRHLQSQSCIDLHQ